jgi:eukaryotic-like serine/threonine-protein kinase
VANHSMGQGRSLGHYRIAEKIGSGGMGDVYRAWDEHLEREVAIKVLPPGSLEDEVSRKRFRKEALALSRLNHPNIATIHDFDTQQGVDFLAMEYIPGITLSEKLTGLPLSEKDVIALGGQVAEGLSAAHQQGVIHRDLKPGNLRLTSDGRVKILDFGLAKLRAPVAAGATTESISETQTVAGTLPYMAPEQLLGRNIDARTDIWAAGCVLYEAAVGRRAFLGSGPKLIDGILHGPVLTPNVSPGLMAIIFKCLEKDPESRYQSAKELAIDLRRMAMSGSVTQPTSALSVHKPWTGKTVVLTLSLAALVVMGALLFRWRHRLTGSDTLVVGDFVNSTGDAVFDGALKQALTVQLEQSPFLNILPQTRIRETMRLMGRSPDEPVTPVVGQELCQRAGATALLWGSIASLGSQYVIGLTAAGCKTGNYLANAQVQARNKEEVLKALGQAASSLRTRLGESLSSVQKFDAPIEDATTSSLEALKTYSLGRKAFTEKGSLAAIPFFERAVDLDPHFAMAYASLAVGEANRYRFNLAFDAAKRAFSLRDRVTERERFRISALYYMNVLGDLERSTDIYRLWAQTYPTDDIPHDDLSVIYTGIGRFEDAIAESREALRLTPGEWAAHFNLVFDYLALNQPTTSYDIINQALRRKIGDINLFSLPLYQLAFLRGDQEGMNRLLAGAAGREEEQELLSAHSDTEAYYGKLSQARFFTRRAVTSELRAGSTETAALWRANAALKEVECGQPALARQEVKSALASAPNWPIKALAALALARIGDTVQAKSMVQEMAKSNPSNTQLNFYWLPAIKAAIEIKEGYPARAITALEEAAPYELGEPAPLQLGTLYPAYLRGQAYLMTHNGAQAAAEFQKMLDHRGIVLNYPLGALAHVQLGRAYLMSGETAKARGAYHNFLVLWKDADPDIPILRQARAEYTKLH